MTVAKTTCSNATASTAKTVPGQTLDLGDVQIAEPAWIELTVRGDYRGPIHFGLRRSGRLSIRPAGTRKFRTGLLRPSKHVLQISGESIAPMLVTADVEVSRTDVTCTVQPATTQVIELELPDDRPDKAHWSSTFRFYDGKDKLVLVERREGRLRDPAAGRFVPKFGLRKGEYRVEIVGWEKSRGNARFTVTNAPSTVRVRLAQ